MRAILISGIEKNDKNPNDVQDFSKKCVELYGYLFHKLHILPKDILFFIPKFVLKLKEKGILKEINTFISEKSFEPLIIYFRGHGSRYSWSLYSKNLISSECFHLRFRRMKWVLKKQRGPLIVIADCCHAMSLFDYLKELKCQKLFIGLSPKNGLGWDTVIESIIQNWQNHKLASPLYNMPKGRSVRYVKIKDYRKSKYCLFNGNDGMFHRYYYDYFFKKIKIVLREGDNLDYLMYPKK